MKLRKENRISFEKRPLLGPRYTYKFENRYGASIIMLPENMSFKPGWELAVLKWNGNESELVYDTSITEDVLPGLSVQEVNELLERIEQL